MNIRLITVSTTSTSKFTLVPQRLTLGNPKQQPLAASGTGLSKPSTATAAMPRTEEGKGKGKRDQVPTACNPCRSAKLKCSGDHPTCQRCNKKGWECEYDVDEGHTRRTQNKVNLAERTFALERFRGIFTHMIESSDNDAAMMLARLRVGATIEGEYDRVKDTLPAARDATGGAPLPLRQRTQINEHAQLVAQAQRLEAMMGSQAFIMPGDLTAFARTEPAHVENTSPNTEMTEPEETGGGTGWMEITELSDDDGDLSDTGFEPRAGPGQPSGSVWNAETGEYAINNINPQLLQQRMFGPPPPRPQQLLGPPAPYPGFEHAAKGGSEPPKKRPCDSEGT